MAATELERLGWRLTGDYKARLSSDEPGNIDNIIKATLDTDLKEIGAAWLDENINNRTVYHVQGPGVLQLEELCVISSPKNDDVESQLAAGICRLSLSDGHISCSAVTLEPIRGLNLRTPPGSKVLVSGKIEVNAKFLLLANNNISLLGGRVSNLVEPWELKKNLVKQPEPIANDGEDKRAPPFVPFGQKISDEMLLLIKTGNFQCFIKTKEKKVSPEEIEFQKHRQAALSEALRDKKVKDSQSAFRSGQFNINYGDVGWIISKGFSPEQAVVALQSSFGNPRWAIDNLFNEQRRNQKDGNLRPSDTQQGAQPLSQGPAQNISLLPNNLYPGARQQYSNTQHIRIYQGDKSVDNFQQKVVPSQAVNMGSGPQGNEKQVGVKEISVYSVDSSKYSAFSKQTNAPLEVKAAHITQSVSESNQSDRCKNNQNQQLLNNVSDKQNKKQQEESSDQHKSAQSLQETEVQNTGLKTNLQEGSKAQDAEAENCNEEAVNSEPTDNTNNASSDCQVSLGNQCAGDYKSSSANLGASNQQQNYQILQNRDFSHRGRDGTNMRQNRSDRPNYNRYNNDQMSYRGPRGTRYFNPPFDRQVHIQPHGVQRMGQTVLVEAPFHRPPRVRGGYQNSSYTNNRGGCTGNSHIHTSDMGYSNASGHGTDGGFTHGQHNNYYPREVYNRGYNSSFPHGAYNNSGYHNNVYNRGAYNTFQRGYCDSGK